MQRERHHWESPALGRGMECYWYGHAGRSILAFPTSHGSALQNEEFGLIPGLGDKIEAGEIQFCCVETVDDDTWQNDSASPAWKVEQQDHYDRYLADEVVPFIRQRSGREDLVAYGASFGGYHAANFSLRHPELVSRLVVFSGVFDVHKFLNGFWNDTCYFHCPTAYVANYDDEWVGKLADLGIVLATGEHDTIVANTREFAALLESKGIKVHHEIWPGVFGHDWPFWIDHLRRFVP